MNENIELYSFGLTEYPFLINIQRTMKTLTNSHEVEVNPRSCMIQRLCTVVHSVYHGSDSDHQSQMWTKVSTETKSLSNQLSVAGLSSVVCTADTAVH